MTNITKGSDLLTLKQVEALEPKALAQYNEDAAKFVADFNAAYPDGKAVSYPINQIVVGDNGRINFVVGKTNDLSTQSIGLPFAVVDRIAENQGCGTTEGLLAVQHSTIEPLLLKMTVKAVKAGDTYTTGNGETRTYKVAAIVKVEGSREEIILSQDALDIVAGIQQIVLKEAILNSSRNRRKTTKTAATVPTVQVNESGEDDSDV